MSLYFSLSMAKNLRQTLNARDIFKYWDIAQFQHSIDTSKEARAIREYKHFLFLNAWNKDDDGDYLPIIPSSLAFKMWQAHRGFETEYQEFCTLVYGKILPPLPIMEDGSIKQIDAIEHTNSMHRDVGHEGFDKNYSINVNVPKWVSDRKFTPVSPDLRRTIS